ncbi:glycosyl hydrolase [Fulvivirga ligni]|uniref:glycosyl hydrolase n=1 Tax=Fulvivirga ligni TaxID=2904246 RepID=UPI001EEEE85F|nr:glycosyl hydrolase [Fulvivirga ligni]UII19965.1 carbohydrate-binding protein [Fulvivirga ligni]
MQPISIGKYFFVQKINHYFCNIQKSIAGFKSLTFTVLLLVISLTSYTWSNAQVVNVGSGSYTTTFPGTDEAGRNTFPTGSPQVSGPAASKPVPSNTWWANFIKVDHGGQAFNYPLSFCSEPEGLVINYTIPLSASATEYREPMSVVDGVKVGVSGLSTSRSTVSDFSDWTFTANWSGGGNNFSSTIGMGMPFVYFTKANGNTARVEVGFNPSGVSVSGSNLIIQNNMNNSRYVVFGPSGTSWSGSNGTYTSSLAGKNYWSMALVPPGMDINTFISNYQKYAFVFPSETNVSWTYNESSSALRTTFNVTPDVKEGAANQVLMGLLPHQWAHLAPGSAQPNLATYPSVRGQLKLLGSNSFAVENKFSGILPTLPNLAKYSDGFDISKLFNKIDAMKGDGLPAWTDSYNEGQNMNRLIQAARIADQIGYTAARDQLLDKVQERLEDWLKAEGGEVAFLFYYNDTWDALLGYPAGHSQDSNLNDHHFHWGYFIHAASALEQFRPGWANQYGGMINLLVKDAGNADKNDNKFPFLRNFSPYAGHAWANGFATEPFGNDQESTSESMQFNASLIHWGTITNNNQIRDLGIYLYTTEVTAIQEYWFDTNDRTFQPAYQHEMIARVWSAGYDNGTWWTSDIAASYGIQLYPIHGGSLYMGYDLDYVQEVWNGMTAKTEVLSNTPNANLWYDTYWSFLAFLDPERAIELYDNYTERDVKVGISDAQTYHWLHTMNALGNVADEITADYPIASVFDKNGTKTYVAHNYGSSARTVHFSDGTSLYVEAGKTATSKDTGISISLSAPGIVAEPCTSGVNSDFTLTANVSGPVSSVEFYRNGSLLTTDNSAPYQLPQSFNSDNVYTYTAKAYGNGGLELSNVFKVTVGLGNQAPYNGAHNVPGTVQAGHYDTGGNGISYFDVDPNVYEANFRTEDEVDASTSASQGTSIGWISAGEWVEYSINAAPGVYDIDLNIAANASEGGQSGSISIDLDCNTVGSINSTPLTGAWDTFSSTKASDISIPAGQHIIRLTFNSGVYNLGNITFTRTGDLDGSNSAPSTPTGLQVTSTTENSIAVSWNASTDPDNNLSGYDVYLNGSLSDNVSGISYTFTGLNPSTTYTIEVNARDTEGAISQRVSVDGTTNDPSGTGVVIPARIQAEDFTDMAGVQMENTIDDGGGQNVGWIDTGDWLEYEIQVPETKDYTIDYRVASQDTGGTLAFLLDGNSLSTTSFGATGGWQNWTTTNTTVNLPAGSHTVRIVANTSGWNLNWIEFSTSSTPPPSGGNCTTNVNADFSVEVSDDNSNPSITFVPERSGVGANTCILYYSTNENAIFPGYLTSPNTPFQLNASAGQTVYYYYTYSLPEGGENNTFNNKKSFVVGQCANQISARTAAWSEKEFSKLTLFPNPVRNELNISGLESNANITVFDLSGKVMMQKNATHNNQETSTLNVSHLKSGVYFIQIENNNSRMKFIKE